MKTKVYKIELLVIDFDDLGEEAVKDEIENTRYANHCISPTVQKIETREVDWSDDHPLNDVNKSDEEYKKLFGTI